MAEQSVLSNRANTAIKTALAMVLAYGVTLSMDWWRSVLSTVGELLNKGLLRLAGTLVGSVAALTLITLFPQDRWFFLACMSVFTGFCAFMMFGTSQFVFLVPRHRPLSRAIQ